MTASGRRMLIVSPYFPPQAAVAALRTHSFAMALRDAGWSVSVLTTAKRDDQVGPARSFAGIRVAEIDYDVPAMLEWLRFREKTAAPLHDPTVTKRSPLRRCLDGLRRLRVRSGVFCSTRMPDLTDWWIPAAIEWAMDQEPWTVVLSSSGPYTAHLVAMELRRRGRVGGWIADFRDLWTQSHATTGLFPFTLRERSMERQVIAAADRVMTVSGGLAERLSATSPEPAAVVYNGFDESDLVTISAEPVFPDDGLIRLVYTGSLYTSGQDPTPLLRALTRLRREAPEVAERLRIVSAGWSVDEWKRAGEIEGVLDLVEAHPSVTRADSLRMQRDADALLIFEWDRPQEGILTAKLFEYLFAAAPILALNGDADDPIASIVEAAGRGWRAKSEVEVLSLLRRLGGDPTAEPVEALVPDRAYIDTFTRQSQARGVVDLVASVAERFRVTSEPE